MRYFDDLWVTPSGASSSKNRLATRVLLQKFSEFEPSFYNFFITNTVYVRLVDALSNGNLRVVEVNPFNIPIRDSTSMTCTHRNLDEKNSSC